MEPENVISTILKHDNKQTSYKIALLRAINDIALSFPDLRSFDQDVAVPLKLLAQFWVAYYWPFVKPNQPILQGVRATLGNEADFLQLGHTFSYVTNNLINLLIPKNLKPH